MCKLLPVLLIAVAFSAANAQTLEPPFQSQPVSTTFPKMEFGVQGGPNLSFFYNEQPLKNPRNKHRPLYHGGMVGISYQYNFTKMVGLRVETNYEQRGDVWYDIASWNNTYSYNQSFAYERVSYITVPVTARLNFGKKVRFFVNSGLYAAIRINAHRVMYDATYVPFTPAYELVTKETKTVSDVTTDIRPVDAGVVIGAGVSFPLGDVGSFTLEGRNNTGFVSLNANNGLYQNRFYNNSTAVMAGLSFFLRKHAKPASVYEKSAGMK